MAELLPGAVEDPPRRNPFSGRAWAVVLAMLAEPRREWSVRGLAAETGVSAAHVSRVVASLIDERLVAGDVVHGRAARLRPRRALVRAAGKRWPAPIAYVQGRAPSDGVIVGGGPAEVVHGLVATSRPIIYVASRDELRRLLALWGGALVSEAASEWDAILMPNTLGPGPLPPAVLAAELASTARGREILSGAPHLLDGLAR